MDTACLGGVPLPTAEELAAMHKLQKVPFLQDYILHARGGKLTKVAVEKSLLPHDPKGNVQAVSIALAPDGAVYVNQGSIMCKSTDGGRTWTSHECGWGPGGERAPGAERIGGHPGSLQILSDGTFITGAGGAKSDSIPDYAFLDMGVCASSDEGRSWQKISEIKPAGGYQDEPIYPNCGFFRLPDDTLLCGIEVRRAKFEGAYAKWLSGKNTTLMYRSSDWGRTWEGPVIVCDWWGGVEGGIARTASGKLLAVIRYQRPLLPDDPPDLVEQMRGMGIWPYKHVFLADSQDEGRTWQNFRQLTTVFGQTRGYPAALSDGTVVVVHDTRYGPGAPGSRAMISYDEGETWEDEVYYLDYTTFTGSYNASVVLEDDVILAIVGSSDAGNSWEAVTGNTDFTAIRWKPVKPAQKQKAE